MRGLPAANLPPQPGVGEGEVCLLRGEEDADVDGGGAHGLLHPLELGAHRRPLDIVRATLALQPAVPDVALGVHGDVAFRMVGVTWFSAWLISDATGPHWLHSLSLPATVVFLAAGAILAGYAGWVGGP